MHSYWEGSCGHLSRPVCPDPSGCHQNCCPGLPLPQTLPGRITGSASSTLPLAVARGGGPEAQGGSRPGRVSLLEEQDGAQARPSRRGPTLTPSFEFLPLPTHRGFPKRRPAKHLLQASHASWEVKLFPFGAGSEAFRCIQSNWGPVPATLPCVASFPWLEAPPPRSWEPTCPPAPEQPSATVSVSNSQEPSLGPPGGKGWTEPHLPSLFCTHPGQHWAGGSCPKPD